MLRLSKGVDELNEAAIDDKVVAKCTATLQDAFRLESADIRPNMILNEFRISIGAPTMPLLKAPMTREVLEQHWAKTPQQFDEATRATGNAPRRWSDAST